MRDISIVESEKLITISSELMSIRYKKESAEIIVDESKLPEKKGDYNKELKLFKEFIQLILIN